MGVRADGYDGYSGDGYEIAVNRVIFPDLSLADDFPQYMTKLDTGLYFFQFTLPKGIVAIGSYLVDVSYRHPTTHTVVTQIYHFIVNAPFGSYGMNTG